MEHTQEQTILSTFADDPDMAELIQYFVSEMPERVAQLHQAREVGDITEVSRLAHQLKGAGSGYGFEQITIAAGKLEDAITALSREQALQDATVLAQIEGLVGLCSRVRATPRD